MPITPACQPSPSRTCAAAGRACRTSAAELGEPALGVEQDRGLDGLALGVDGVQLARDLHRALLVGGQHQLQPGVGAVQAPGRVDPRREREAERRAR